MVQNQTNLEYEILLLLAGGPAHLREIARATGAPHASVMRRLNRLAEGNVLDFRREGRNKTFSIKKNLQAKSCLLMAERYKLQKLLGAYPRLSVILSDLLSSVDAPLVVLFGSHAKFLAKPGSDIDVYVETGREEDKKKAERVHSALSVKIGPFDNKSPLIKEIIKNHVILRGEEEFYEKTGFFA
jgi:predicted nucleotidyltransferase